MLKKLLVAVCVLIVIVVCAVGIYWKTRVQVPDPQGYLAAEVFPAVEVTRTPIPPEDVAKRGERQQQSSAALGIASPKQILFGDTHVHTTYSMDAFAWSLPMIHGSRGAFPPADVCDYARYVSQLDFYFLTDHAESYTAQHWRDQVESVRQCNEVAGDPENPDVAAFIGWEWSQVGITADTHYGHHNVFLRDTDADKIPARPIGAAGAPTQVLRGGTLGLPPIVPRLDPGNRSYYDAFNSNMQDLSATPNCAEGVNTRDLPADCFESVATPGELFTKLREWDLETLVVPHGTTWGYYTPPRAAWEYQLTAADHDPKLSNMIEVHSGHGNSEPYRAWVPQYQDADENQVCPEPTPGYLPSCWQAGEIIRGRCAAQGLDPAECDRRAAEARQTYVDLDSVAGWLSVSDTNAADWLDSGQARDIFSPAFNYRPRKSVQYGLALRNFEEGAEEPLRYRWGFISSSDNHTARPGAGFKEYDRLTATESSGPRNEFWRRLLAGKRPVLTADAIQTEESRDAVMRLGFRALERERQISYFTLGGLAAVHADGRSRDAIWDAMKRKEVYGTSGPRILLWFDLLNRGADPLPMGGEVEMANAPAFRVRATGAFKQLPGCPEYVKDALSAYDLERLASGECYNPSDERYLIDRIEVVRIRPQNFKGEPVADLIDDPWLVLPCEANPAGCSAEFSDAEFPAGQRDALYYVRAIQEKTPIVNADGLRPRFDAEGNVVSVDPCYGDYRTDPDDDCLADAEHRAWSSPIFVDYAGG